MNRQRVNTQWNTDMNRSFYHSLLLRILTAANSLHFVVLV